eukprot:Clim_evm31s251 gene=Clim_evmTU31s251
MWTTPRRECLGRCVRKFTTVVRAAAKVTDDGLVQKGISDSVLQRWPPNRPLVLGWGDAKDGQMGVGIAGLRVELPVLLEPLMRRVKAWDQDQMPSPDTGNAIEKSPIKYSLGANHVMAIIVDEGSGSTKVGKLVAFGSNFFGQIGKAEQSNLKSHQMDEEDEVLFPRPIPGITSSCRMFDVNCGLFHNLALGTDDSQRIDEASYGVWSWGSALTGDGSEQFESLPTRMQMFDQLQMLGHEASWRPEKVACGSFCSIVYCESCGEESMTHGRAFIWGIIHPPGGGESAPVSKVLRPQILKCLDGQRLQHLSMGHWFGMAIGTQPNEMEPSLVVFGSPVAAVPPTAIFDTPLFLDMDGREGWRIDEDIPSIGGAIKSAFQAMTGSLLTNAAEVMGAVPSKVPFHAAAGASGGEKKAAGALTKLKVTGVPSLEGDKSARQVQDLVLAKADQIVGLDVGGEVGGLVFTDGQLVLVKRTVDSDRVHIEAQIDPFFDGRERSARTVAVGVAACGETREEVTVIDNNGIVWARTVEGDPRVSLSDPEDEGTEVFILGQESAGPWRRITKAPVLTELRSGRMFTIASTSATSG